MSLLLLIDGYNVVAPAAPPGGKADATWLQRERMQLIHRLTQHLDPDLCRRTCVVFDAANPPRDRPDRFQVNEIDIRFAVGYGEADDLIEELIGAHSAPKSLAVVSSDHRVQAAAKRRGSSAFDSEPWIDQLVDGYVLLAASVRGKHGKASGAGQGSASRAKPEASKDPEDVDRWLREFGF